MIFFTSDMHFGHANVIKYCNRPFKDVTDMDESIIRNWNSVVQGDDSVYIVGDLSFYTPGKTTEILYRLNGHKFIVPGNHDTKLNQLRGISRLPPVYDLEVDNIHIVLCHFAMRVWNRSHKGSYHLYGHSHGTLPDDPKSLSFDVGVDCWNYTPVSMSAVIDKMSTKIGVNSLTS